MEITEVRIRLKDPSDSRIRAMASVTFDNCFVVHDIKIITGKDGLFISMPSRKTSDGGFIDIVHPLNNEMRDTLKQVIIKEYNTTLDAASGAL